jgi:hypothetical protein
MTAVHTTSPPCIHAGAGILELGCAMDLALDGYLVRRQMFALGVEVLPRICPWARRPRG